MQRTATLGRWMQAAVAATLVLLLAACGGGGGGGGGGSSQASTSGLPANPGAVPVAATASNTAPVAVGSGVASVINIPTVTVTICAPGAPSNCQSISNVQVDTGSYGLRIVSSVLNASLSQALTPETPPNVAGDTLVECTQFADGYSWGTVRTANVQIAGERTATSVPIQVIGDMPPGSAPTSCVSGASENSASAIGANGILGIGVATYDCGSACASGATYAAYSNYYACSGTNCARAQVPMADQVTNPVTAFPVDNNGVILEMSPISQTGAGSATGTLVFGIGTESNNALAAAQTFTTNAAGDLNNSTFGGKTVQAFLDSGSNAYFFADGTLGLCSGSYSGFYCPSTGQTRTVTLVGLNGVSAGADVGIMNAASLFANSSDFAFNDLGGDIGASGSFDLGLPFFYGRYVYVGFDQTANGGQQPYVGY
jgi:hypothetical protein